MESPFTYFLLLKTSLASKNGSKSHHCTCFCRAKDSKILTLFGGKALCSFALFPCLLLFLSRDDVGALDLSKKSFAFYLLIILMLELAVTCRTCQKFIGRHALCLVLGDGELLLHLFPRFYTR
jgi:hypothetical protein